VQKQKNKEKKSPVCDRYFSHPKSQYFGVGKIGQDQLDDYAERKKEEFSKEEIERWLSSNLV
jgi:5-methyltetrahydrofolate--homocysteine methyltransferase